MLDDRLPFSLFRSGGAYFPAEWGHCLMTAR
jgi:hypothetical protein